MRHHVYTHVSHAVRRGLPDVGELVVSLDELNLPNLKKYFRAALKRAGYASWRRALEQESADTPAQRAALVLATIHDIEACIKSGDVLRAATIAYDLHAKFARWSFIVYGPALVRDGARQEGVHKKRDRRQHGLEAAADMARNALPNGSRKELTRWLAEESPLAAAGYTVTATASTIRQNDRPAIALATFERHYLAKNGGK